MKILRLQADGNFEVFARLVKVVQVFVSLCQSEEGFEVGLVGIDGVLGGFHCFFRQIFLEHAECEISIQSGQGLLALVDKLF